MVLNQAPQLSALSTDTFPTTGVANGTELLTTDTRVTYIFDATNVVWRLAPSTSIYYAAPTAALSAVTSATNVSAGMSTGPGNSTLSSASVVGTVVIATTVTNFYVGERIVIGANSTTCEIATVAATTTGLLTLASPLLFAHTSTTTVIGSLMCITPQSTGRLKIRILGALTSGTSAATCTAQLAIANATTVAAIASGSALTNYNLIGGIFSFVSLTGALTEAFCLEIVIGSPNAPALASANQAGAGPLTVGTPYLMDLAIKSSAGTLVPTTNTLCITIEEF